MGFVSRLKEVIVSRISSNRVVRAISPYVSKAKEKVTAGIGGVANAVKQKIVRRLGSYRFAQGISPYFKSEKLFEGVSVASAFTVIHIAEFYLMKYFTHRSQDVESDSAYGNYGAAIGNMLITTTTMTLKFCIMLRLSLSLDTEIKKDIFHKWLKNGNSAALKHVQEQGLEQYDFYVVAVSEVPQLSKVKVAYKDKLPILIQDSNSNIWVCGKSQKGETMLTLLPKKMYKGIKFTRSVVKVEGSSTWFEIYKDIAIKKGHASSKSHFNVPDLLFSHVNQFSSNAVSLAIGVPSNLISLGSAFYIARGYINNNYVIVLSSAFLAFTGFVMQRLGEKQTKSHEDMNEEGSKIGTRLMSIDSGFNEIIALRTEGIELEEVFKGYKKKTGHFDAVFRTNVLVNAITNYSFNGFPLIFKWFAPSFLPKEQFSNQAYMEVLGSHLVGIMSNFRELIGVFTETYPKMKISLDKLHKLEVAFSMLEEFHKFQMEIFKQLYSKKRFVVKDLSFSIPNFSKNLTLNPLSRENVEQVLNSDEALVLKNIHIVFKAGQVYLLVGESGLGKSTFLKAILGLWHYTKGRVFYPCGKDEVCFIPQNPFFPIDCSLFEAITYGLPNHDKIDRKELIRYLMLLGLSKLIPRLDDSQSSWDSLSRGQQQRLGIIRILVRVPKPKVLIMDESMASIDLENRKIIEALLKQELKESIIIYTEHNPLSLQEGNTQGAELKREKEKDERGKVEVQPDTADVDENEDAGEDELKVAREGTGLGMQLASVQRKFDSEASGTSLDREGVGAWVASGTEQLKPQQAKELRSYFLKLPRFSTQQNVITIDEKRKAVTVEAARNAYG